MKGNGTNHLCATCLFYKDYKNFSKKLKYNTQDQGAFRDKVSCFKSVKRHPDQDYLLL